MTVPIKVGSFKSKDTDVVWRAEVKTYSVCDDSELELYSTRQEIILSPYTVVRRTPKGAWVTKFSGIAPRFMRTDATKRFAAPTPEEAMQDLWHRANRRAGIYWARMLSSEEIMSAIEQWKISR